MTEINIDSREPMNYKIEAMERGDCIFKIRDKLIRIERKNYSDLIHSLNDGRLAIQLNQLKADRDFPILAVIGYPNIFNIMDRKAFRNLLLGVKLTGVIVERYDNETDYKNRIIELYEYFSHEQHDSLIPYRYTNPKYGALMW